MDKLPERQMVGYIKIEHVVYLALMYELIEERYGPVFIPMCNAVQEEVVLLCSQVPLDVAIACVNKKFEQSTYSIKQGLIAAMQLPDKKSMS